MGVMRRFSWVVRRMMGVMRRFGWVVGRMMGMMRRFGRLIVRFSGVVMGSCIVVWFRFLWSSKQLTNQQS